MSFFCVINNVGRITEGLNFININWHKTIVDDLVFGSVMEKKSNCARLLNLLLHKHSKPQQIDVIRQKVVDNNQEEKGSRLDIFVEDVNNHDLYDLEMQRKNDHDLAARIDFYLSHINGLRLKKGQKYKDIRDIYVIFLCTFDYFGKGQVVYDLQLTDKKNPEIVLPTKAHFLIFNAAAVSKTKDEQLRHFLELMHGKIDVLDENIRAFQASIDEYIKGPEWRARKMKFEYEMMKVRNESEKRGLIKGIKKLITAYKEFHQTPEQTLTKLINDYSSDFSKEELAQMVKKYY